MSSDDLIKVFVPLQRDEDGYPPVDWEELWASRAGNGTYRIDNIPFYAPLLSHGDTVTAEDCDGRLVVSGVVGTEGHSTIRIVVFEDGLAPKMRAELGGIGCPSELSNAPNFFSVDVPPSVNYADVLNLIERYANVGAIDFEESSIRHQ
jgi:hypothetical protein